MNIFYLIVLTLFIYIVTATYLNPILSKKSFLSKREIKFSVSLIIGSAIVSLIVLIARLLDSVKEPGLELIFILFGVSLILLKLITNKLLTKEHFIIDIVTFSNMMILIYNHEYKFSTFFLIVSILFLFVQYKNNKNNDI